MNYLCIIFIHLCMLLSLIVVSTVTYLDLTYFMVHFTLSRALVLQFILLLFYRDYWDLNCMGF